MKGDLSILLVDDDEVDREAVLRAFKVSNINNPVACATNGMDALKILRGIDAPVVFSKPAMVLLDLNMPQMNGFEFLEELRGDHAIRDTVVFVLSTSTRDEDIERCYQYQVAGYISKKTAGQDLCLLSELLDAYWRLIEVSDQALQETLPVIGHACQTDDLNPGPEMPKSTYSQPESPTGTPDGRDP